MVPKGRLLIIGGKEDRHGSSSEMEDKNHNFSPHEILKDLITSKDDRIEVITTASSEPESMRDTYRKTFNEIGYSNFGFIHITETDSEHEKEYMDRIRAATTVFFTGGDQAKICGILKNSEISNLLYEKYRHEEGFMIAGTSAGAMCIPEIVICEAENGEAIIKDDIEISSGLGFIKNCIVDTHFVHRGRFGRLAHAVMLHKECWGLGIGEDTALLIEEGAVATCKGSGMVVVISAGEIRQTNIEFVSKGCPVYAENLKVHILTDDCILNLDTGAFKGDKSENC